MTLPYKLQVRLGDSEFSAEGDEATVKEQFQMFLEAMKAAPPKPTAAPAALAVALGAQADGSLFTPPQVNLAPNGSNGEADGTVLERVFSMDDRDSVSLKVLPKTPNASADALIILLYGFLKLRQKDAVFAPSLMGSARQSGIMIDRIDRVIDANEQFYNRAGTKRSTRYSLNNRGQLYAMDLMRKMLE